MSASSKKKLRKEQEAAKLTEKQLTAQKEAKITKLYTAAFIAGMAVILVIAIVIGISQYISNSGIRENKTVAVTVGEHQLSNAELNYYYIDTINNFYSQNGSYAAMFGLDVTAPLDEQVFDESTGETWADYFLESAKNNAATIYALADAAKAAGHTLSEDEVANLDNMVNTYDAYAVMSGYPDTDTYLKAMYGRGANKKNFRAYVENNMLAESYNTAYSNSLTYEDADLRAAEAENYDLFSSYDYNYYLVSASRFLEGGTTAEDGTVTYSDAEEAASVAAAEAAAKAIVESDITTVEAFDAAIAAMEINSEYEDPVSSITYNAQSYSSIDEDMAQWLSDEARKEGEIGMVANNSLSADGETSSVTGYYIMFFRGENENDFPMKNVRHILVQFEGGTADEMGNTTYTDEEKSAAKTAAETILNEWKSGEATEDSFAALAAERSNDTGSTANGGLYENVYPGQMVTAFNDWCYDESRKAGDTGIVETEYGYHVMFFVGNSQETYRDFQIRNQLASADHATWYNEIVSNVTVTDGDTKYIAKDLVLQAN